MLQLLAHQGGWDELLWFSIPIVIVVGWVRWAERRARSHAADAEAATTNMPDDTDA